MDAWVKKRELEKPRSILKRNECFMFAIDVSVYLTDRKGRKVEFAA
jgi:hypothetical protein